MVFTIQERVEIVKLFYRNQECARATARLFTEIHPDKPIRHKYVLDIVQKFSETGSVANRKHQRHGIINDEATSVAVLGHVALMENTQSIRKVARESGFSTTSVFRILHKHKYHPYKIKLVHELNEDDFDRRLEFCELFSNRIENNEHLLYNICFSDESTFFLNGYVNKHNCRFWSDENPFLIREDHTQRPQKLNVWAGILGDHIIGPFFLEENLNGQNYLNLLENLIYPHIVEIMEQDHNLMEDELVFQQDGAPPHYALPVRQFLDATFPEHWIGRRGPVEWPARSPDLTPLDFFLWGYLKSKVYETQPASLEELRQRITYECQRITPEVLQNVRQSFQSRLYHCMEVQGGHFEQMI